MVFIVFCPRASGNIVAPSYVKQASSTTPVCAPADSLQGAYSGITASYRTGKAVHDQCRSGIRTSALENNGPVRCPLLEQLVIL